MGTVLKRDPHRIPQPREAHRAQRKLKAYIQLTGDYKLLPNAASSSRPHIPDILLLHVAIGIFKETTPLPGHAGLLLPEIPRCVRAAVRTKSHSRSQAIRVQIWQEDNSWGPEKCTMRFRPSTVSQQEECSQQLRDVIGSLGFSMIFV